jgi:hypothetical protein
MRRRFFQGPALCDKAIDYSRDLETWMRRYCTLSPGELESILDAVQIIRYASFVAGSWQHEPMADRLDFPPIGE